jgi:lipid II isoglutaminyl synthase (glutamine-hydrolysing)
MFIQVFLVLLYSYCAKALIWLIQKLKLGSGTSMAGILIENCFPQIISILSRDLEEVIFISGTNGKTTTRSLITKVYRDNGIVVCTNSGGANIMRGIGVSLLLNWDWRGRSKAKAAILEVEEATLPRLTKYLKPQKLVLLNIFRDQLDVYGEIDTTLNYFRQAIINSRPHIIINKDDAKLLSILSDPQFADSLTIDGFGITDVNVKMLDYELLSLKHKIKFANRTEASKITHKGLQQTITINKVKNPIKIPSSELGNNNIAKLDLVPKPKITLTVKTDLLGDYNAYNILACVATTLDRFRNKVIEPIENAKPVFGRGEKIIHMNKTIYLFLVKNPAGMNQVLKLIKSNFATSEKINLSFVINDNIADGKDISWLWDCNMLEDVVAKFKNFGYSTSGTRGLDMLLRLDNAKLKTNLLYNYSTIENILSQKILAIESKPSTHIILATYTAMTELRSQLSKRVLLPDINSEEF